MWHYSHEIIFTDTRALVSGISKIHIYVISQEVYFKWKKNMNHAFNIFNTVIQMSTSTSLYRVQSQVVRRLFSLQPLVTDVCFQLQNWFKKYKNLCYGTFKFQKSILWKLQKLNSYTIPWFLQSYLVKVGTHHNKHNTKKSLLYD